MPTQNRREFIRNKVRKEFRSGSTIRESEEIEEAIVFAKDGLENAVALRRHLTKELLYEPDAPKTTFRR